MLCFYRSPSVFLKGLPFHWKGVTLFGHCGFAETDSWAKWEGLGGLFRLLGSMFHTMDPRLCFLDFYSDEAAKSLAITLPEKIKAMYNLKEGF